MTALGQVLLEAGKTDEAEKVLADAVSVCEEKGFSVGAQKARELLASARGEVS